MRKFKLEKLVRDGIVEDTQVQGGVVEFEKLQGDKLISALMLKLEEETDELHSGTEPTIEKLADIREIIDQLALETGRTIAELNDQQTAKRDKLGGFAAGHFVHTIELPDDNRWAQYYASNPKRFPEVIDE